MVINSSNLLNDICSRDSFKEKTTLDQIEFLNRYRARTKFWLYSNTLLDAIVRDQPNQSLTYDNVVFNGQQHKTIYFRFEISKLVIRYPVDMSLINKESYLNDLGGTIIPLQPRGNAYAERYAESFLRWDTKNSWSLNEQHSKFFKLLRNIYLDAWLELKRQKVQELKGSLNSESVNEFIAARRAEKTQAIMDIAMHIANLTAKLETYRSRIGNVHTVHEAEKMYSEVEKAIQGLQYTQERNKKRLNTATKIPGGKKVKSLTEKKEE